MLSGSWTKARNFILPPPAGQLVQVKPEGQAHELGPSNVAAAAAGAPGFVRGRFRRRLLRESLVRGSGAVVRGWRDDQGPPARVGGQHSCIDDHVLPGRRHRSCQTGKQGERGHFQRIGAVAPWSFQLEAHPMVGQALEALVR